HGCPVVVLKGCRKNRKRMNSQHTERGRTVQDMRFSLLSKEFLLVGVQPLDHQHGLCVPDTPVHGCGMGFVEWHDDGANVFMLMRKAMYAANAGEVRACCIKIGSLAVAAR